MPMDSTYKRAMESIRKEGNEGNDLALRTLSWLVQAKRTLMVGEIQVALSVKQNQSGPDELDIPDKAYILDCCLGLVSIDETKHTIHLAHQTVHEYLLKDTKLLRDAEFETAMAFTTYLSFDIFAQGACDSFESFESRVDSYPFLQYVARYLPFHLQKCDEKRSVPIVLRLLDKPGCIDSYLQANNKLFYDVSGPRYYDKFPKGRGPLHVAVALKHHAAIVSLSKRGGGFSTQDSQGRTTLHAAAYDGDEEVVRLLLDNGADVSLQGTDGCPPLHRAAKNGHKSVVQLLLERGADLSVPDNRGRTALHEAALRRDDHIAQVLLEHGANVSAVDNSRLTPLHIAAFCESEAILRLLLRKGADVSILTSNGESALHFAAIGGNEKGVQILLETEVNPFVLDKKGRTALDVATSQGFENLVRLLETVHVQFTTRLPG